MDRWVYHQAARSHEKRVPEPTQPQSRASLPEGCSDLMEAYEIREASAKKRELALLRIAAVLHDRFVAKLEPGIDWKCNEELLRKRISDFLHPLLLARPDLAKRVGSSSWDLVEMFFQVVKANAEENS
jgi:hypothetical protein